MEINLLSGALGAEINGINLKDSSKEKVNRFGKEIAPVITNGPPGITGFSGGRPKAQEIIAYWPTLIDKNKINIQIDIL